MRCRTCGEADIDISHVCGTTSVKIRPLSDFELPVSTPPIKSIYWFKELPTSSPAMHPTFLTEDKAHDMFKGHYAYGRVSGIGGLL